jgi:hypothetical protein
MINNFNEENKPQESIPKSKQLVRMLSFRVVPAYFREIEKVAKKKKMSVSKLIRVYIKDGLRRDNELDSKEEKEYRVE